MAHTAAHADAHSEAHYWKVWGILLVLLVISIFGPFLGIQVVTLITAFGIAIVKAYMVAKNFMHLNIERRYVVYLIMTMLVFVLLFFAGTAPDVMKWEGDNWVKHRVEQASSHATEH
jgi:caa(3)-type oxidase subunit IV